MKELNLSALADRLLYGPTEDDQVHLRRRGQVHASKTESAATSPTIANSLAPTATITMDESYSVPPIRTATTSPSNTFHATPVTPTRHETVDGQSATSSPTLASNSPVDIHAKEKSYSVEEVETSSPKSTKTGSSPTATPVTDIIDAPASAHSQSRPARIAPRRIHPAVKAWKSIWDRPPATWHPTALQIRPLVGILGLCIAVVCAFASLAVLLISDGQPTAGWYVSPAVLLAIITAAANSAIALAYMEAVPVSFWYSMTRGRSIRSLERQWQVSRSVPYAVSRLRHLSVLNVACIAVALVIVDGPLLQRSSTVVRATQTKNVTLSLRMVPELPSDFSGTVQSHNLASWPEVSALFPQYTRNVPMRLDVETCVGKCLATIQAPGVMKTGCSQEVWPITPEMVTDTNASWGEWRRQEVDFGTRSTALPSFEVSVAPIYTLDSSAALMRVGLASWFDLTGNYTMTTCTLVPAISEYDVIIEHDIVSIPKTPAQGRVLRLANNTRAVDQSPEAMPRVQEDAMDAVSVDIGLVVNSNVSCNLAESSSASNYTVAYANYALTYNLFAAQHDNATNGMNENSWYDPTDDIVFIANEFMFRAGVISTYSHARDLASRIDPGVRIDQHVAARQEQTQNVYASDIRWWVGAAAVQIAAALVTLPMFWGWWRLGCNLTLSPFSIALAFDAPLVGDVNSAAGTAGVVERLGGVKIKYGAVGDSEGRTGGSGAGVRLGVAESSLVCWPREGMTFER